MSPLTQINQSNIIGDMGKTSDIEKKNKIRKIAIIALSCMVFFAFTVLMLVITNKASTEERVTTEATTRITTAATTEMVTEVPTEVTTEELTEAETATPEKPDNSAQAEETTEAAVASRDYSNLFRDNIEDKEKPRFLIKPKTIKVDIGDAFDINDHIGYGDDADRELEVSVSGAVDTSTPGTTPIQVSLKDDAGNITTEKIDVSVVESAPAVPSGETDLTPFSDFASTYGGDGVALGIDVSRWQNDIDFNKVKAAGCDFVIMRIGGYDDGVNYTDRCYQQNIKNAKAAGLKIGIYWHAEESSRDEVINSVKYLLNVLKGEKLDFPIAYDWEDFEHFQNYKMNIQDLNDCYAVFSGELGAAGYKTCIYGSKNFMGTTWNLDEDDSVWLAHYTANTDYTGKYFMWQQTSKGKIDGISTACDFNVLYGGE